MAQRCQAAADAGRRKDGRSCSAVRPTHQKKLTAAKPLSPDSSRPTTGSQTPSPARPGARRPASALQDFEAVFFNNATIALDRYYVHRLWVVTGRLRTSVPIDL